MEVVKLSQLGLGNKNHDAFTIVSLMAAVVMFVVAVIFNGLAGSGKAPQLFYGTVGELSDKYDLPITPAGFTFSIWSIIYTWLTISLITMVVSLFLSNQFGKLYLNPPFMTPLLNVMMTINFALNLTWIFVWDRSYPDATGPSWVTAACVVLIVLALTNITIVAVMVRNIYLYQDAYKRGTQMFKWGIFYRIIVNGFGIYTTWTVIAALVNFTHALVYGAGVDKKTASMTALSLLFVFHVAYFILEIVFAKYLYCYLVTPFMVVIWALVGIRAAIVNREEEGEDPDKQIKDYVTGLLVVACITLGIRLLGVAKCLFGRSGRKMRINNVESQ